MLVAQTTILTSQFSTVNTLSMLLLDFWRKCVWIFAESDNDSSPVLTNNDSPASSVRLSVRINYRSDTETQSSIISDAITEASSFSQFASSRTENSEENELLEQILSDESSETNFEPRTHIEGLWDSSSEDTVTDWRNREESRGSEVEPEPETEVQEQVEDVVEVPSEL